MLIAVLVLQAPALLPPLPEAAVAPDPAYSAAFADAVADAELTAAETEALRPAGPGQRAALRRALLEGSADEQRAAALLAAGEAADSPLALAALRCAWDSREEATALAALLSPEAFPASAWPALAWICLDPERPTSVRAAACGRLLRSGCRGAWPVARSLLRTGTAGDEQAPWADWNRLGRYELPKRLLVLDLDAWFQAAGEPGCGFEPNAAWQVQLEQLAALESRVQQRLAATERVEDRGLASGVARLLRYGGPDPDRAFRAAALLVPHATRTLQLALTKDDPALVFAARRAFELLPR